jgi:hypothetical protein
VDRAELEAMREKVAAANGIVLYRLYNEAQAAHFLQCDITTVKRLRRAGRTPYVNLGERKIRYMGHHICDLMIFGVDKWKDFSAENIGFPNTPSPPSGSVPGTAEIPSKPSVSALAQETFPLPKKR